MHLDCRSKLETKRKTSQTWTENTNIMQNILELQRCMVKVLTTNPQWQQSGCKIFTGNLCCSCSCQPCHSKQITRVGLHTLKTNSNGKSVASKCRNKRQLISAGYYIQNMETMGFSDTATEGLGYTAAVMPPYWRYTIQSVWNKTMEKCTSCWRTRQHGQFIWFTTK